MKIKFFLIAFITFTTTVKAQVQVPSLPISDSVKRAIIHYVTDANLDFMAYKNPNIPVSRKYSHSFNKIMARDIFGLSTHLEYWPPYYYGDFIMDVKTWGDSIYYITKKSNCFLREIYSDSKHKDLVQRDTICADLDTNIFLFNNRFVVKYNPQWPITDRYYPLAGNLHTMESEVFEYNNDPGHYAARELQVHYRMYQFGTVRTGGGRIPTPDTCNYYTVAYLITTLSSKPVKVKFPKRGPMDYIEIEFYTNNPKYTRQKGTWDGSLWRVKYVLRNDAESIYDWYPKVTKLTNDEYHKVNNSPDKEFKEIILTEEMIAVPHTEPEEIPKD